MKGYIVFPMNLGQKEIKKFPGYGVAKIKFEFLLEGFFSAQLEKICIGDFNHLLTTWTSQLLLTKEITIDCSKTKTRLRKKRKSIKTKKEIEIKIE